MRVFYDYHIAHIDIFGANIQIMEKIRNLNFDA